MAVSLSAAGLDQLDALVARHVDQGSAPGAVVLVARGDAVHVFAAGEAAPGRPMTADTQFRITSTTKPITAALAMTLLDDNVLALNAPVTELLPELADRQVLRRPDGDVADTVPAERAITLRDLLTFTFGFGLITDMFVATTPWPVMELEAELQLKTLGPPDPTLPWTPDEWMSRLGALPLLAQPGERWMYNTGAAATGVLISRALGRPLPEVLRERLLTPLGMSDTGFVGSPERLPMLYQTTADGLKPQDPPDGAWTVMPRFPDGAAGLVSTATDLLAFARMLLHGGDGVLTPATAAAMCQGQLSEAQRARGGLGPGFFDHQSWGFCQAVEEDGSFGWAGGFGTTWRVEPTTGLIVMTLTQVQWASPHPPALFSEVEAAAHAALAD
jgi:CubicO group peptidase (beta-lactamase class C family)